METTFKGQTVCTRCKYYRHTISNPSAPMVWYNHRCGHPSSLRHGVDYTLGHDEYERAFCRDVNPDGNCRLYEVKES